jgi:hypothetical protein
LCDKLGLKTLGDLQNFADTNRNRIIVNKMLQKFSSNMSTDAFFETLRDRVQEMPNDEFEYDDPLNVIKNKNKDKKNENLQLTEDKMYVGIWDDAQDDFITYREFNSFGDALEFASKYDYSDIKSGVVKFDTNSLFTKGFASEFDIVNGKTDLKAMQELMPKNKDVKESFTRAKSHKLLSEAIQMGIKVYEVEKDGPPEVGRKIIAFVDSHEEYTILTR